MKPEPLALPLVQRATQAPARRMRCSTPQHRLITCSHVFFTS